MDDPWANAWGEPAKPPPSHALPSWSTDTPVSWAEPSPALWAPSEPVLTDWAAPDDDATAHASTLPASPQADDQTPPSTPEPTLEPVREPEIRSAAPPASPDARGARGAHESVLKSDQPDLDPWATGSVVSSAPEREDVWTPSWEASDQKVRAEEPVDEWEEAKRQKVRQDEYVVRRAS